VIGLREGHLASYVGDGHDGIPLGAQGEVLSLAGSGAYVKWVTGSRLGAVDLVHNEDLVAVPPRRQATAMALPPSDDLDDSLDVGFMPTTAALQTQEDEGAPGLLTMMASQGRLRGLGNIADEVLSVVAHRVRQDESVREVTSQLDGDQAEDLVQLTALSLLQNAFGATHA
jgi:hypothetical protein